MGSSDAPLAELLSALGLSHLAPLLSTLTLAALDQSLQSDRPAFLAELKALGVSSLKERQALANGMGRRRRQHGAATVLRPGDAHLFFTRYNWQVRDGVATSACPGALLRLAWKGPPPSAGVSLQLAPWQRVGSRPGLKLGYAFDGGEARFVTLAVVGSDLEVPLSQPGEAADSPDRQTSQCEHSLQLWIHASVQSADRWAPSGGTPECALRIAAVRLPPGAATAAPRVAMRTLLAFGDSLTEVRHAPHPWPLTASPCPCECACFDAGRDGRRGQGGRP